MNTFHSIKRFIFFCCMSSIVLIASDDSTIRLDETTMDPYLVRLFRGFLGEHRIDTTDYGAPQYCSVGVNRKVSADTAFDKFLQRSGASESDMYENFIHEGASLDVRTLPFSDTVRMRCRSENRFGDTVLYLCINVIPWAPGR